jgi:hypothetical protein
MINSGAPKMMVPPRPAAAPAEDQDDKPATPGAIAPEAVSFRTAEQTCGTCEFNEEGTCSKLSIPVEDSDGCNLYSARDQGAGEMEQQPAEEQ